MRTVGKFSRRRNVSMKSWIFGLRNFFAGVNSRSLMVADTRVVLACDRPVMFLSVQIVYRLHIASRWRSVIAVDVEPSRLNSFVTNAGCCSLLNVRKYFVSFLAIPFITARFSRPWRSCES